LEWRRNIKEDGCGRKLYKGGNLDDWDGIFHFKGGNEGKRLWMVLLRELQKDMMYSLCPKIIALVDFCNSRLTIRLI
jgi:hypothetical protein